MKTTACTDDSTNSLTIGWSRAPGGLGSALALLAALVSCGGGATPEAAAPDAEAPATEAPAADESVAPPSAEEIVAASDRTEADREADARRHPVELLQFLAIAPGARVADLGAGGGYTTELLVRAVGSEGQVYAQNNAMTLEKFVSKSWAERLERPVMKGVVRMDREYEDPFAPEAKELDLVTLMFSYHDVIAQGGDREKLNAAVFAALKPGGAYVVADHAAAEGSGLDAASKVHRVEESIVRHEIEAAGFAFDASADFLANASDDKQKASFSVGFKTDRYLLRFKKPE